MGLPRTRWKRHKSRSGRPKVGPDIRVRTPAPPVHRAGAGGAERADVVHQRLINDDLRAVADLFAFVAANPADARSTLGPSSPRRNITQAHADSWFRAVTRIPHRPGLNDRCYVDDHTLAQIPAAQPLLGLPRGQAADHPR